MINDFRGFLLNNYKKCVISGADIFECDAAHLLPQSICYKLNLPDLANNGFNGLLLSKNLHWSFDNFVWCFDIFDCIWVDDNWCMLPVITVKNKRNYSINQYAGTHFKVPILSLPYLWLRYEMFIHQNYVPGRKSGGNCIIETDKYREFMSTMQYNNICSNPKIIDTWKFNNGLGGLRRNRNRFASANGDSDSNTIKVKAVLDVKKFNKICLTLFEYKPWSQLEWIDIDLIPPHLINNFSIINENSSDPNWGHRKRYKSI
jgi:hypothetical protein